jgi:hypothetical protein
MKFCRPHWDKLKQAIKSRGLFDLVAGSAEEAMQQAKDQLSGEPQTLKNFDPLMGAHWMILNNAMDMLGKQGINPLFLFGPPPEDHPEWECLLCYLNFQAAEHDRLCTDPKCQRVKGENFDTWIDRAADSMLEVSKTLPK